VAEEVTHPFDSLTPDFILETVERLGYLADGRLLALNSYENRVYQIGIEDSDPIIAKYYRPQRWSETQILEEHEFCFELANNELPIVAPIVDKEGISLFQHDGFRFALYPRRGGRTPDIDDLDNLLILGRLLGRIHLIGATRPFAHRPPIDCRTFGHDPVALIKRDFITIELAKSILKQQIPIDDKQELSDQIIENIATIEELNIRFQYVTAFLFNKHI